MQLTVSRLCCEWSTAHDRALVEGLACTGKV